MTVSRGTSGWVREVDLEVRLWWRAYAISSRMRRVASRHYTAGRVGLGEALARADADARAELRDSLPEYATAACRALDDAPKPKPKPWLFPAAIVRPGGQWRMVAPFTGKPRYRWKSWSACL